MKFGDKLISLRKKRGLSQEELASKLNVSRQSVSKWESNNTYPETDKIIQICNIFDCRMDDLINDKVTDVTQCERKNKNNLVMVFDSLLEFITKTINMFTSMKFSSGLRCIIELGILIFCLFIVGLIISGFGTEIIMKLFGFLPNEVYFTVYNAIQAIIEIILVGVSFIIIVHIFKIRYLDFYDKLVLENKIVEEIDNIEEKENEEKNNNISKKVKFKFHKNEPKIIIRDKHTTYAFLSAISKIIIGIWKAIVGTSSCFFMGTLILLVSLFVFGLSLCKYSFLFIGSVIGIIAMVIINVLILFVMINYVINRKSNLKLMSYIFLGSLILFGGGVGIGLIGFTGFTIKDSMSDISENISKEIEVDVVDNMVIQTANVDGYKITINNSMSNDKIKVIGTLDKNYFKNINYWSSREYGMKTYTFHNSGSLNFGTLINLIYNDLENKVIRGYYIEDGTIEIVCNSNVAKMLIDNAEKIYLVDYEKTDTGYNVIEYSQKIYLDYNCELEYNALSGKYSCDNSCVCKKETRSSAEGLEIIDFNCYYKDNYTQ